MRGNALARVHLPPGPPLDLATIFLEARALATCALCLFFYNNYQRSLHFAEYEFLTGETSENRSSGYFLFGSMTGNVIYCPNCSTLSTLSDVTAQHP